MQDDGPDLAAAFVLADHSTLPGWLERIIRPPKEERRRLPPLAAGASGTREGEYARAALEAECAKLAETAEGGRNQALNVAAFSAGTLIGAGWVCRDQCEAALHDAALACGLDEDETRATIASGIAAGLTKPRAPLGERPVTAWPPLNGNGRVNGKLAPGGIKVAAPSSPARIAVDMVSGSAVNIEPISWLWGGWLARGKLHVIGGAPGTGKTTIALALAATATRGGTWPDRSRCRSSGNVVMWSGEDDPADTLAPRLVAMGADMSRIFFVTGSVEGDARRAFDPAKDVAALGEAVTKIGDVSMLIVDPIVSAIAGDSHKNSETRRGLQPLVDLAQAQNAALLGVTHFTKGTSGRDPLERVTGSLAFGALARIVLVAAKGDGSEGSPARVLARAKSNIGLDGGGFGYDLEQKSLFIFTRMLRRRLSLGASRSRGPRGSCWRRPKDRTGAIRTGARLPTLWPFCARRWRAAHCQPGLWRRRRKRQVLRKLRCGERRRWLGSRPSGAASGRAALSNGGD